MWLKSVFLSLSDPSKYRKCSPCCPQHGGSVSGNVHSAQQGTGQNPHGPAATGTVAHMGFIKQIFVVWYYQRYIVENMLFAYCCTDTNRPKHHFQCLNCCVFVFSDRPAGRGEDTYQCSAGHHRPAAAVRLPAALWNSCHSDSPALPITRAAGWGRSSGRGQGRRTRGHSTEYSCDAVRVLGQWGELHLTRFLR